MNLTSGIIEADLHGLRTEEAIEDEFSYGREEKVKKIRQGSDPGITELV